MRLSDGCKDKSTLVCRYGTFRFEVMPFGLINAPVTFQRMMDHVLEGLAFARVYVDDVVIFSKTVDVHVEHTKEVLRRITKYALKVKLSKCSFYHEQVQLVDHVMHEEVVRRIQRRWKRSRKFRFQIP